MQLIGMLDSPYVRRVAITLLQLELPFDHQSISVFRGVEAFSRVNPVVKAPTLVCDDGTVLMDSTLIIEYAQRLAHPRSLMPADPAACRRDLRLLGLALAACEKSVQDIYERNLRPPEKQHAPWLDRVSGQLHAALDALEAEWTDPLPRPGDGPLRQAALTTAVTWRFLQGTSAAALAPASRYPKLAAFSDAAERLPAFAAAPHGDGVVTACR